MRMNKLTPPPHAPCAAPRFAGKRRRTCDFGALMRFARSIDGRRTPLPHIYLCRSHRQSLRFRSRGIRIPTEWRVSTVPIDARNAARPSVRCRRPSPEGPTSTRRYSSRAHRHTWICGLGLSGRQRNVRSLTVAVDPEGRTTPARQTTFTHQGGFAHHALRPYTRATLLIDAFLPRRTNNIGQ